MFAASMVFVALSYFYYEYVPESAFSKDDLNGDKMVTNGEGIENKAYYPENVSKSERKFSKASLGDSAIDSEDTGSEKSDRKSISDEAWTTADL